MRTRGLIAAGIVTAALLFVPAASAKDLAPGDLRLCNDTTCVAIVDRGTLRALSRFYYSGPPPRESAAPRLGTPYLALTFRNGYVTGVAASAGLDRFRSHGVNMGQFGPDPWYRIPPGVARSLRALAAGLRPLRVTASTIGRSRYG